MRPFASRFTAVALVAILGPACAATPPDGGAKPSRSYLYVFAGDDDRRAEDTDFLGVIDADPASPTYARVVATAPIKAVGTMPHHTELTMPGGGAWLFANGFMSGRTFLFDLADPLRPRLAATVDSIPGYSKPHSYWRLADGRVLTTLQYGDSSRPGNPGGVALLSPRGEVLRAASSADPRAPDLPIRTYSLDVAPAADRFITTSTPMEHGSSADVVQVWRLSDLTLVRTLPLDDSAPDSTFHWPFEVRFLPGDSTALLNTWYCGFYLLSGLNGTEPRIERLLSLAPPGNRGCSVPLLVGRYWIVPVARAHQYLVYDVSDPRRPRQVQALATDTTFRPHWISRESGSDRLVLTSGAVDHRVLLAHFDSSAGRMSFDSTFRDSGGARLGVSFDRAAWPHGASGAAMPHGAIFSTAPARPRS
jgi:56kDa selenium binding protein (SBP56)